MKKKYTFFLVVIGIISLVSGGYIAFGSQADAPEKPIQRKIVHTKVISPTPFLNDEVFSGFVRGANQTILASKTSGSIIKLLKEEGDFVRQGEILAYIENTDTNATNEISRHSLDMSNQTLLKTKQYYDQKVREASAALDKTEDEYRNGDATKHDVNIAEEALKSAKKLRDTAIASATQGKTTTEGESTRAQVAFQNTILRAPFTGIIIRKHISIGAFVMPGSSIYSIASSDTREITISIPAQIARTIKKGDSVNISSSVDAKKITGYVFSISPLIEETTSQSILRIRPKETTNTNALHLGEYVHIAFSPEKERLALMIPESSIIRIYDDTFIYTVTDGLAKKQSITLGGASDGYWEVIAGLSDGAHVVIGGVHEIRNNDSVEEILLEN